jgi:CcmD family protein
MRRHSHRRSFARLVAAFTLAFVVGASAGVAVASTSRQAARPSATVVPLVLALQQPPAAQDEYVPVSELPVQEQLPAAPLLIAAYGFVWLALIVYVVVLWRRIGLVEREIQGLQRRVTPAATSEARRS